MTDEPFEVVFVNGKIRDKFRLWLETRDLVLYPIPNGEVDGKLVLDHPDQLPCYGIMPKIV